jgi:hypothetical protein
MNLKILIDCIKTFFIEDINNILFSKNNLSFNLFCPIFKCFKVELHNLVWFEQVLERETSTRIRIRKKRSKLLNFLKQSLKDFKSLIQKVIDSKIKFLKISKKLIRM